MKHLIKPTGKKKSKVLLIGWEPEREDISAGEPFANPSGDILRRELSLNRVDIRQLRTTYFWTVPIPKMPKAKEDKIRVQEEIEKLEQKMLENIIKEADGKDAILIMGAKTVKTLCGVKVSLWSGLEVECDYFDAPLIMCMVSPGLAKHNPLGEVRLAIRKFANKIKKR